MALTIGTRLGRYEVLAAIGEGGMGQVYRAHDTELDRDVALKVLPDSFVHDPERLARFEREARMLASLNHPHIAAIHGLERSAGQTALVMELVEGEDLSRIIARGLLALTDALAIARQIAEALDAAHERGIIHRDLKPANIKVRADGTVKVLDFGLAKPADHAETTGDAENSPTLTARATQMGVILGTAAYMSPEQARGKPVDKRTDIWAFGVVLFEMIAGRRPFDGEDVTELLAGVVKSEPDWTRLPPTIPPYLTRLLRRCLEKDRRKRLRDIGDVLIDLDEPPASPGPSSVRPARSAGRERLAWFSALVLLSAVVGIAAWRVKPAGVQTAAVVTRFPLTLSNDQQLGGPGANPGFRRVGVSPDGTVIVYTANGQIFRRSLDDPKAMPIAGTDGTPGSPVFSPNGRSIAYVTRDYRDAAAFVVRKTPVEGGPAITLARFAPEDIHPSINVGEFNLSWSEGQIFLGGKGGVMALPDTGGRPKVLIPTDPAKEVVSSPQLIGDGRQMLFSVRRLDAAGVQANSIVVQTLGSDARRVLVAGGTHGVLLPTGRLVYLSGNNMMGVAFDAARVVVTSDPVVLASDATQKFAVSDSGTLVYEPATGTPGPPTIVWVDRAGREEPVVASSLATIGNMRLSPDRTRIALTAGGDIWIWTFARNTMTRLSLTPTTVEYNPAWMPDGHRVVYDSAATNADRQILVRQADGSGSDSVITPAPGGWPDAVSPDGKYLLFHSVGGLPELMLQSIDPAGRPKLLAKSVAMNGEFSPDGRWIAYQSTESGRLEIYVQPFPAIETGRWMVSTEGEGGRYPLWSPTGRELFFLSDANALMAASIDTRTGFEAGTPARLFPVGQYAEGSGNAIRNFDVSMDGKKFLFVKRNVTTPPVSVVTNWFQEVEKKLDKK